MTITDPGVGLCDTCGNPHENLMSVSRGEAKGAFDSFECAIEALAPRCAHCHCRILGHGVESDGRYYCCDHCARTRG